MIRAQICWLCVIALGLEQRVALQLGINNLYASTLNTFLHNLLLQAIVINNTLCKFAVHDTSVIGKDLQYIPVTQMSSEKNHILSKYWVKEHTDHWM